MKTIYLSKLPRTLSEKEVAMMFKVSESIPRDNILLKCIYYLGLKNSEVQNLEIKDIDFQDKTVTIRHGKKERIVPIPGDFSEELKRFISNRLGLLFIGRGAGGALSDRHIRRIVKSYACKANVRKYEEIHPHSLRHSYATHLQNNGVPLNVIQTMLGHERLETTAIYTHLGLEKAREYVDKAFRKDISK